MYVDYVFVANLVRDWATTIIYIIGVLAILLFLFDNFKSPLCILKALLEPYFEPQLPQQLSERYGKWAGEFNAGAFTTTTNPLPAN